MTTNAIEPYLGPLPEGWTGGQPVTKFWRNNFMHLYRVRRACVSCGAEITLDVTKAALEGTKQNAGLKMKNCPACRHKRRHGGPGSRGGTSRPVIDSELMPNKRDVPKPAPIVVHDAAPVVIVEGAEENAALRMSNQTMREEIEGLYGQLKELRERLAQYELPAALREAERAPAVKLPWQS